MGAPTGVVCRVLVIYVASMTSMESQGGYQRIDDDNERDGSSDVSVCESGARGRIVDNEQHPLPLWARIVGILTSTFCLLLLFADTFVVFVSFVGHASGNDDAEIIKIADATLVVISLVAVFACTVYTIVACVYGCFPEWFPCVPRNGCDGPGKIGHTYYGDIIVV